MPEIIELRHKDAMDLLDKIICYGFGVKDHPLYDHAAGNLIGDIDGGKLWLLIIKRRSDGRYFATEYRELNELNNEISMFGASGSDWGWDDDYIVEFKEAIKIPNVLTEWEDEVFAVVN